MLTYSFADIGSESIYIYLYKCIKNDILSGVLRAGEKLPSKRSFAKNLGISTITVENAYAQLQAEGYIYSIAKKGFFVNDISENQIISKHIGEITVPASAASKSYIADFVSNRTSPENFPFSVWAGLMRKVISEQSNELMTTSPGAGVYELRKAICDHLF
ncbi:MAG: GntR family transcriptional regulator, partial [Oscillospiraceae bacterium]